MTNPADLIQDTPSRCANMEKDFSSVSRLLPRRSREREKDCDASSRNGRRKRRTQPNVSSEFNLDIDADMLGPFRSVDVARAMLVVLMMRRGVDRASELNVRQGQADEERLATVPSVHLELERARRRTEMDRIRQGRDHDLVSDLAEHDELVRDDVHEGPRVVVTSSKFFRDVIRDPSDEVFRNVVREGRRPFLRRDDSDVDVDDVETARRAIEAEQNLDVVEAFQPNRFRIESNERPPVHLLQRFELGCAMNQNDREPTDTVDAPRQKTLRTDLIVASSQAERAAHLSCESNLLSCVCL